MSDQMQDVILAVLSKYGYQPNTGGALAGEIADALRAKGCRLPVHPLEDDRG